MSLDSLCLQTNKLVQEVQHELGNLERASSDNVHIVENQIQARIDQVVSNCERLYILVNKEPPNKRASAKMRVDQLRYDCQHIQSAMRNIQHKRYQKEEEEREREELLNRSFAPNETTAIKIDADIQHNSRLHDAHKGIDNMIGGGSSILDGLREQRSTLKGAHKKMLDVANYLGMSNTVMRLIERRTYQDKFILYGGMIVTCIIMFILVRYYI